MNLKDVSPKQIAIIAALALLATVFVRSFVSDITNKSNSIELQKRYNNEIKTLRNDLEISRHHKDSLQALVTIYKDHDKKFSASIERIERKLDKIPTKYNNVSADSLVLILERRAQGKGQ